MLKIEFADMLLGTQRPQQQLLAPATRGVAFNLTQVLCFMLIGRTFDLDTQSRVCMVLTMQSVPFRILTLQADFGDAALHVQSRIANPVGYFSNK